MKLNWNFLGGEGVQNKKPSVGGLWIFSGSVQLFIILNFIYKGDFGNKKAIAMQGSNPKELMREYRRGVG